MALALDKNTVNSCQPFSSFLKKCSLGYCMILLDFQRTELLFEAVCSTSLMLLGKVIFVMIGVGLLFAGFCFVYILALDGIL